MSNEMELEILDLLETGWTDEQIIGSLLQCYQIETGEARATLDEVLVRWMDPASIPF